MGISTTSQPRAKRKLDRAQPQEEGRHRSCAAPLLEAALYRACASRGASAECQSKTTGSRPWLELYRRYAAEIHEHDHSMADSRFRCAAAGRSDSQDEGAAAGPAWSGRSAALSGSSQAPDQRSRYFREHVVDL